MTEPTNDDTLVIERTFTAPIDQIWGLWTDPTHFAAWYGPAGASIPTAMMDVRVGGARMIAMEMQTPDGPMRMWFAGEYLEVDPPSRLRYTEFVADEHGAPMSIPGADGHTVTEVCVELHAVDDGTHMVLTHVGIPAGSPGAAGWSMALDKLTQLIGG